VARSDIFDGEELFSIPRGLVLSVQNSKLKDLLSQDLEELGPWLSLILVMMYEYLLGEQSAWAPYFKVLPKSFDTLMFWSPSELQELQGSAIVSKIGKEGAEDSIMQMIAPVVRANPFLFPPVEGLASWDGEAGAQTLLGLAHIMGSLIMAYAFDIEKVEDEDDEDNDEEDGYVTDDEQDQSSKGMVPLADILNADADRNNVRALSCTLSTCVPYQCSLFTIPAGSPLSRGGFFGHESHQAHSSWRGDFQRLWRITPCRSSKALWLCNRQLRSVRCGRIVA
jgi:SET domain-containing protein 6